MRKGLFGFGFVALFAVGCAAETDQGEVRVEPTAPAVEAQAFSFKGIKRQLVVFKSDTLPADAGTRLGAAGAKVRRQIKSLGVAAIDADAATASKLAKDPAVAFIGADRTNLMPNYRKHGVTRKRPQPQPADFLYGAQWDMRRIHAPAAWANVPAAKQAKVTVAVIDVGVFDGHPDLAGRVVASYDTSYSHSAGVNCPRGIAEGAPPGFPDYFTRVNVETGNDCEPINDADSIQAHGTHVAGTIAGNVSTQPDGSDGAIVGVGPNLNIAAYRIFDRVKFPGAVGNLANGDYMTYLDGSLLDAIADAADRGYPVANMSIGGTIDRTDPEQEAVYQAYNRAANLATRKGLLLVAAAGNDSSKVGTKTFTDLPGDLPAVVSVSATGSSKLVGPFDLSQGIYGPVDAAPRSDVLAFYSNYGKTVDVSAPGGDCGPKFDPTDPNTVCEPQYLIVSSVPFYDPELGFGYGWDFYAGTSMASPHVAGVAALIKAKHPNWGPLLIRAQLQLTAQSVGSFWNPRFGTGIVDADRATR